MTVYMDQPFKALVELQVENIRQKWLAQSEQPDARRFTSIAPIASIALIGTAIEEIEDMKAGIASLRKDDVRLCRAIVHSLLPHIPLAKDCSIDLFANARDTKAWENKPYDLAIFCNVPEADLRPEEAHPEGPNPHPNSRFIATWGHDDFGYTVNGSSFAQAAEYDLDRSPGARLFNSRAMGFAWADCGFDIAWRYTRETRAPFLPVPHIDFLARYSELEMITANYPKLAFESPLFSEGVDIMEKLDLLARIRNDRAQPPVSATYEVEKMDAEELQKKAARPLNFLERAQKGLRELIP